MPSRSVTVIVTLLLALFLSGCGAPAAAEAPPEVVAPFPTTTPFAAEPLLRDGEPLEFLVCGGSPTWRLPSREAQQREVWATMLRGASERQRMEVESSFTQPLITSFSSFTGLVSALPEEAFQRLVGEYGLWDAPAEAWGCRAAPLDPTTRAVEVLMKGYRVSEVRRLGGELLIWGEPAPGFEWGRVLLPPEWGDLMVHVYLSDGSYGVSQWVPAEP